MTIPIASQNDSIAPAPQDAQSTLPGFSMTIAGGAAGTSSLAGAGGNLVFVGGVSGGASSLQGHVMVLNLPTTNPSVKGALYGPSVAGAVSISAG